MDEDAQQIDQAQDDAQDAAEELSPLPAPAAPAPARVKSTSPVQPPAPGPRPAWWTTAEQHAASAGVDSDTLWQIAGVESGWKNAGTATTSSANGIWQITRSTWDGIARNHPDLGLTDRRDPDQQAKAAAWLLKDKNAVLAHNLGRQPTAPESYLAWFVGEHDASKVLRADPNAPIGSLVAPGSIAANASIFRAAPTAGALIAWSAKKMGDAHYSNTVPPDAPSEAPDMGHLNASTVDPIQSATWEDEARAKYAQDQDRYGYLQAAGKAFTYDSAVSWLAHAANIPTPDPAYSVTPADLKKDDRLQGIPMAYQTSLLQSRSQAEYDQTLQGLKEQMDVDRRFAAMGLGGSVLRAGVGLLDPAGWAVGAALTPIGGEAGVLGYKLGRIGRMFTVGAEAAGANMLTETPRAAFDPTFTKEQMLYAGAGGFVFGAGIGGLITPHPVLKGEFAGIDKASTSLMRNIEANVPSENSVGAAANRAYVEPVRADVHDFTNGLFLSEKAQKSAMGAGRFDLSAKTKNSDNPLISATGGTLMEDAVGNVNTDVAVARATSVEQKHLEMRVENQRAQAYQSAAADYRERNGIGKWAWDFGGEGQRFRETVADAIENQDPTVTFDPAVMRAVEADRQHLYGAYADLGHNPGLIDGTTRPPVRGMEDNLKDPNYFPHQWDFMAFGEAARRFGDKQMKRFLGNAFAAQVPDAADRAERVGAALYKGLRNVQAGQEAEVSRAISGHDTDLLRGFLRDSGLGEDEIGDVVRFLNPEKKGEGNIARTKRRTPLNALYGEEMRGPDGMEHVSIKDLLERDYLKVGAIYNRQMSAQVALARTRIENPRWTPGDTDNPQFLLDGIRGSSDWERVRQQAFAVGDELGHDPKQTEHDWSRLDFAYKAISGQVHDVDKGKLGSFIRILKDLNFMRVMNQVGFAQVADIGGIVSQAGFKAALSSMPSLRGVLRDMRTGQMKLRDAQEIDSAFAAGTDWIRGSTHLTADDFGNITSKADRWGRAEDIAKRGSRITAAISGMAPINAYIQRWATKAAIARFAYEADGEMALNAKRMRVLGLTDADQKAIAAQIQRHRGPVLDQETGLTRTLLNLDQWDPAARHAFEYAVFTWSRKMVQENDLGQMTTVLGSTMGKLMFQFRMFTVAGWSKNTLHSLHMRDTESLMNVMASSVLGGLAYAAQSYLQAQGRPDKEDFLEKKIGPKGLIAGAIGRAGWSSLLPQGIDLGTYALGMDPIFDTRVTGQPSQGLLQFPIASMFDNAMVAARGAAQDIKAGQPLDQKTARAAYGLLPFSNFLPAMSAFNAMVSHLPEHPATRD